MFFKRLEMFADAPALLLEDAKAVSYAELALLADRTVGHLPAPSLVIIEMRNEVMAIAAYLGALRRSCPVLLTAPGDAISMNDSFGPASCYTKETGAWVWSGEVILAKDLHPELGVLLSTSGSTGSAKLVRLSTAAVEANAQSIVEYLGITSADRAITSLPLHYSYGLSVLNSHLSAGGSILLTERSVVDPLFWTSFRAAACTSFAGVPHSYELLERLDFRADAPPSLQTMTQAGGRLAPDLVQTYAAWSKSHGRRFFAMYGQTEATARIAFLPPDLAEEHPDCIGRAIPGGELHVSDGELIYRGPNVMMGYATERIHLGDGPLLTELATGDLAQEQSPGIFKIVGRKSRFSKIAGKRVALDEVESLCAKLGHDATVAGNDQYLAIWLHGDTLAQEIEGQLADRIGIPQGSVFVAGYGDSPRLPSGKTDYQAILAGAAEVRQRREANATGLADEIALSLGCRSIDPSLSFEELGGDSLAYVQASMIVETRLGFLPDGWESIPIKALSAAQSSGKEKAIIPLDIPLRVLALLLVIIGHASPATTEYLRGGALVLFFIAGASFSKFQIAEVNKGRTRGVVRQIVLNLVLPYALIAAPIALLSRDIELNLSWLTLTSVFFVENRGPIFAFWFIETLIHCQIITTIALFSLKKLLHLDLTTALPKVGLIILALGLAVAARTPDNPTIHLTVDGWLWAFALGCVSINAGTNAAKAAVILFGAITGHLIFPNGDPRWAWLTIASMILLFGKPLSINPTIGSALLQFSAASYFIYLAHVPVVHVIRFVLKFTGTPSILACIVLASMGGLIYARAWRWAFAKMIRGWETPGKGLPLQGV